MFHETNTDGTIHHTALLKRKSPGCSVLTQKGKVSLSNELVHFPLLGNNRCGF